MTAPSCILTVELLRVRKSGGDLVWGPQEANDHSEEEGHGLPKAGRYPLTLPLDVGCVGHPEVHLVEHPSHRDSGGEEQGLVQGAVHGKLHHLVAAAELVDELGQRAENPDNDEAVKSRDWNQNRDSAKV